MVKLTNIINPQDWLSVANVNRPKLPFTTDWVSGKEAPIRPGFYERHFTDSMFDTAGWSMQYWDGEFWRVAGPSGKVHWRQVGDYPCWRGLTKDQYDMQQRATQTK